MVVVDATTILPVDAKALSGSSFFYAAVVTTAEVDAGTVLVAAN